MRNSKVVTLVVVTTVGLTILGRHVKAIGRIPGYSPNG